MLYISKKTKTSNAVNMYMKIHAETIPIKGYNRSVIYDLPRKNFYLIPNDMYKFIIQYENKNIDDIKKQYNRQNKRTINEYLRFLKEREMVFFVKKMYLRSFPKLPLQWDYPGQIRTVIIDYSGNYSYDKLFSLLNEIDLLGAKYLHIRYFGVSITEFLIWLTKNTNTSGLNAINVSMNYDNNITRKSIANILAKNVRIETVNIYNIDVNEFYKTKRSFHRIKYFTTNMLSNAEDMPVQFIVDVSNFSEAHKYNTYFNKTLYIGKDGEIKNSLFTSKIYGNIAENKPLVNYIKRKYFTNLWYANKDDNVICKHCEFRYMCFTPKVPSKFSNDKCFFTRGNQCYYNPFISKWKNEKGYVPVEECGTYSMETGFIPDKKKIAKLNKLLWAE